MPAMMTAPSSAPTSTPTPIAVPASEPAQGPTKVADERRPVTLELVGAVKRYGEVTALAGVDLALRAGEVTAVLGPNGAGKTTAVGLLAGLLRPTEGRATAFGGDPASPAARCRMGVMLQVSGVPPTLKVGEHLDLFRSYYPGPLPAAEVIRIAGLEGLEDRPYGKLSGGQQQRLLFALALAGNPDVLFLDEPTVGLDVSARRGLWEGVRRLTGEGRTILLTTHYLDEADALADRIVVLDRGRVVADGSPSEVKSRVAARRVRFHSRLPMETVRALPEVVEARRDGADYELLARRAEPVVRRLLDLDPDLSALEVTSAGLEEAFLALTRQAGAEPADLKAPADSQGDSR